MTPISALIAKYFPEEKVKSEFEVFFTSKDLIKLGNIPVGGGVTGNMARLVETDKNYYFDQRVSTDFWVWFVMGSILSIIITVFTISGILQSLYPMFPKIPVGIAFFVISAAEIIIAYNVAKVYCDIGQIGLIKKEWISSTDGEGNTIFLKGKIPLGEVATFASQVAQNKQNQFLRFPRFLSGLFKGASFLTGANFNISYTLR